MLFGQVGGGEAPPRVDEFDRNSREARRSPLIRLGRSQVSCEGHGKGGKDVCFVGLAFEPFS